MCINVDKLKQMYFDNTIIFCPMSQDVENSGVGLHGNNYSFMPIIVTMAQKRGPDEEKSDCECLAF
jgi:hypothetical protein